MSSAVGVRRDVGRDVGQEIGDLGDPVGQVTGGPRRARARRPAGCRAAATAANASGLPSSDDSASRADSAAVRKVSAWPSRCSSSASEVSSPASGATASISASPNRSRSASRARSRALATTSSSSARSRGARCTARGTPSASVAVVVAAVGVEGVALRPRLEQAVLVGLAVHGHQRLGHFRQPRDRHRRATDERPRTPLGGDVPGEQDAGRPRPLPRPRRPPRRRPAGRRPAATPRPGRRGCPSAPPRCRLALRAAARARSPPWSCRRRSLR